MSDYVQAGLCGLFGGLFSPICFLSTVMGGGLAVGLGRSKSYSVLTWKKVLQLGLICGICSGSSALLFWNFMFVMFQRNFQWFFSHSSGQTLISLIESHLWYYGLVHFLACIPLSIIGAFCSYAFQDR